MFKIVKSSTLEAKEKQVRNLENDLRIVKEREQTLLSKNEEQRIECAMRGDKIARLTAQNEACKAVRDQLDEKINKFKAVWAKQGDELVVAKDEVKQLKRSLEKVSENMNMFKNQAKELSSKVRFFEEKESRESDFITAINAAITEMRKTRKGRTSLNNIRAFEILKSAIGQK